MRIWMWKSMWKTIWTAAFFLQIQSIIMEENPGEQSSKGDPTVWTRKDEELLTKYKESGNFSRLLNMMSDSTNCPKRCTKMIKQRQSESSESSSVACLRSWWCSFFTKYFYPAMCFLRVKGWQNSCQWLWKCPSRRRPRTQNWLHPHPIGAWVIYLDPHN